MFDRKSRILIIDPPIDLSASGIVNLAPQTITHPDPGIRHSPLWMITREPLLNDLVVHLQQLQNYLQLDRHDTVNLRFSRAGLEAARTAFAEIIRRGEETLHRLSELICNSFLNSFQLESVVIGEIESTGERFTLTQRISEADLYSTTDIDLGNRQLNKLRFFDGIGWSQAHLVANVVDYQPTQSNPLAIHRITSRIKAEEELWNKVVDEIFNLDAIVVREKKLRHLSRFVKDVFGVKIVVAEQEDVQRVHDALVNIQWSDETLRKFNLEPGPATRRLEFIEFKDYLAKENRKKTGWNAYKSVIRWAGKTVEIQIQPLRTFLHEREWLTGESHKSFKVHRESIREQVALQIPLFGFYQRLLRWLFLEPDEVPPEYEGIRVIVTD